MRPNRERATNTGQAYMITSATWGRHALFHREAWSGLLMDTASHDRRSAYLLHEFVVMPDPIHVLLTPKTSLEKAVQFVKGGFSFRANKELGSNLEVWQKGFSDHRIRDAGDYLPHLSYMRENPVRKRLCERAEEFPYSPGLLGWKLDPVPQGLKPSYVDGSGGAPEGAPFQPRGSTGALEDAPFQSGISLGTADTKPIEAKSKTA